MAYLSPSLSLSLARAHVFARVCACVYIVCYAIPLDTQRYIYFDL